MRKRLRLNHCGFISVRNKAYPTENTVRKGVKTECKRLQVEGQILAGWRASSFNSLIQCSPHTFPQDVPCVPHGPWAKFVVPPLARSSHPPAWAVTPGLQSKPARPRACSPYMESASHECREFCGVAEIQHSLLDLKPNLAYNRSGVIFLCSKTYVGKLW